MLPRTLLRLVPARCRHNRERHQLPPSSPSAPLTAALHLHKEGQPLTNPPQSTAPGCSTAFILSPEGGLGQAAWQGPGLGTNLHALDHRAQRARLRLWTFLPAFRCDCQLGNWREKRTKIRAECLQCCLMLSSPLK